MGVTKRQCPERGEIGWLTMNPQAGREQAGRRPVVCLSPKRYNRKSGLAIFCPITSKKKGYPFEVEIDSSSGIDGVVLADQLKSLDWKVREFSAIGSCTSDELNSIIARSVLLIQED
ncbi:MAG: type II toxin-antitoxin system PemK/MazF family toxin [Verrucomicrobiales bacterium]|jgi:mRNA interferase MazF|nr:type II toxin-antitoxin system PemK/MazF family toxin [Verrucomicrobiales bacterium]MBP9224656.1 type II toxin-antitoxin system PemK/MazF family toxin [Verrucomicrobiales bacterium]